MSPIKILFIVVIALVLAVVIDLALSHAKLDAIGFEPGSYRVIEERRVFFRTFDQSFLLLDPRTAANRLKVHVRRLQSHLQNPSPTKSPFVDRFRSQVYATVHSVLPCIEVFSLRVLSLLATAPLIAIACLAVGMDGWVRREVRKAGAGIESARIYHVAKRSIKPLCLWVSLVYLTIPVTLDVRWFYGILAVAIPILVGITISRFKKYV